MKKINYEAWKAATMRFLRVAVSVIIAGLVAKYANDPYYLALSPIISAVAKYLRDKYQIDIKII